MNDNSIINETLISRDNLELYKNETDKKIRNHVENKISENIDETLKNIENYNQRLYINEGGIGDEITQRLNALHKIDGDNHDTSLFDLETEHDLDEYDNDGFIMKEEEEFIVEDEGDE